MIPLNTSKGGLKMKKRFLAGLAVCLLTLGLVSNVGATPVTLVDQGSQWQYQTLGFTLPLTNALYSSVDWTTASSWATGNAAFGNSTYQSTYWAADTDLALLQTFNVSGLVTGSATLNVASDNGFTIFLNGMQIASANAEGYTNYWEYTYSVTGSLFSTGVNELAVLAEDHGGATCFDMELTADVRPVPLPSAVLLFGTGIAGLAGTRLRRKKL
jgi:hypothetical protein